jgi:hypothetical protein
MSEYIYATISRNNTTIADHIYTQLDKTKAMEAAQFQGADPHFVYTMFTLHLSIDNVQFIRQGDYVTDPNNIDPKTNAPRKYLIISDPEPSALTMSWRWVAERMRGT